MSFKVHFNPKHSMILLNVCSEPVQKSYHVWQCLVYDNCVKRNVNQKKSLQLVHCLETCYLLWMQTASSRRTRIQCELV